jgi:hypothetical protein
MPFYEDNNLVMKKVNQQGIVGVLPLVLLMLAVVGVMGYLVINRTGNLESIFAAKGGAQGQGKPPKPSPTPSPTPVAKVPLNDLGTGLYLNQFQGGLYENGTKTPPQDHNTAGATASSKIKPLDANGNPASDGKIVLLSIGMSNTHAEWCGTNFSGTTPNKDCGYLFGPNSNSLMAQAAANLQVNHNNLVIVNGAQGGQDATAWSPATHTNYDMVRDQRLATAGVTEKQVQAAWLKEADLDATVSLSSGSTSADAYNLEQRLGNIIRAMKVRYPNLQVLFLTSRIYGGYQTGNLAEPYAYETGFSVKWLIQAQIAQMRNGGVVQDAKAGDLNYNSGTAPWISWAVYPWANGANPRSDGLTWLQTDYNSDFIHPNANGIQKMGTLLMNFFLNSPHTKCWFSAAGCP